MQDSTEQVDPDQRAETGQQPVPAPGGPTQAPRDAAQPAVSQNDLLHWDGSQWVSNVPSEYAIGQTTPDGLWSWNGYEWRSTTPVPVESQSVAAPLSYVGSAQRIWRLSHNAPRAAFVPISMLMVACAWIFVTWWYVLIFGVFGIFVIPFRLVTRGQRKRLRQAERQHREMMAMLNTRR